jgi:hypothetical protein
MTLTIIKTTNNRIFGGFTTVPWDSSNGTDKTDYHSFVFSVDERTKYPIVNTFDRAIYCYSSYGPLFGNGHTICVYDNSNANTNSFVENDNNYNVKKADGQDYVLNGGTRDFKTTEIEVYQVTYI